MRPTLRVLPLLVALAAGGRARAQAPELPLQVEQLRVDGSPVRRATVVVDYPIAFPRIAARLLDFNGYPTFLRRFQSARVVRRNRAETDVYFEVELPRALGRLWFLHRMTVLRQADRLLIDGVSREGNAGYVETHIDLRRTGPAACRLSFSLYAVPTIPAHPDSVNQLLVNAVRGGAEGLHRSALTP